jgi:hypothetical protein
MKINFKARAYLIGIMIHNMCRNSGRIPGCQWTWFHNREIRNLGQMFRHYNPGIALSKHPHTARRQIQAWIDGDPIMKPFGENPPKFHVCDEHCISSDF